MDDNPTEKGGQDSSSDEIETGLLGRYEIRSVLGRGGFGTVYEGFDSQLQRLVAIKVPSLNRKDASEVDLYRAEAQSLAKLQHQHIVSVYDIGCQDGQVYIVTELLDGPTLRQWAKQNTPDWRVSAALIADLAEALAHAHSRLVVHRDVKPGNVVMTFDRGPVLVDFGLAISDQNAGDQIGSTQGTIVYMSPEQVDGHGHRIDGRTDVYALGTMLYQLITGKLPFRSDSRSELQRQILQDEPQPPRQLKQDIPERLEQICLRALEKRVSRRYTTAMDLADRLRRLAQSGDVSPSAGASSKQPTYESAISVNSSQFSYEDGVQETEFTHDKADDPLSLSESTSASDSFRSTVSGRRHITVVHFNASAQPVEASEADPEDQLAALHAVNQLLSQQAEKFGGSVLPGSGNEKSICFGYPLSYEDAPRRAVTMALQVMQKIPRLKSKSIERFGIDLNLWISIHCGIVVVSGEKEQTLLGEMLTTVTKIDRETQPDEVIVTEDTLRLVNHFFDHEPLAVTCTLPKRPPIKLHRITAATPQRVSWNDVDAVGYTPLVGRDHEVNLLIDRWQLVEEGMGQLVALIGEAGLGKSRLIQTIRQHVAAQADESKAAILEWNCSPYHANSSFQPVIESIRAWLSITSNDPIEQQQQRLIDHLDSLGFPLERVVPIFFDLLSLPPHEEFGKPTMSSPKQKELTVELILQWVGALARQKPLLFIVEDLHWIDPSTLDILQRIADQPISDPYLCLQTFRPEFTTPWQSRAHQTQIALNRLTRSQVAQIISTKLEGRFVSQGTVDRITERTDGVPLFVEEYAKMLAETESSIEETTEHRSESTMLSGASGTAIPASLQDLLTARLDRIDGDPDVIRLGAAIGREFTFKLIAAAAVVSEQALAVELNKLVDAQILFQRGVAPNHSYQFKHALIQDAAYDSMLRSPRQELHERIAGAIERLYPKTQNETPELLAYHHGQAGQSQQAAELWEIAGTQATTRGAFVEAAQHMSNAMSFIGNLPESSGRDQLELKVQVSLGIATLSLKGYAAPELETIYNRRMQLSQKLTDPLAHLHASWAMASWRIVRDEVHPCIEIGAQMLTIAKQCDDDGSTSEALFIDAIGRFYHGEFSVSLASASRGWKLYDADECSFHMARTGQHAGVAHLAYMALALWNLGKPKAAVKAMRQALSLAEGLDHPFSVAFALHHASWLAGAMGRGDEAIELAQRQQRVAQEQAFFFWETTGMLFEAAGLLALKQSEQARELLQVALARYAATGARLSLPLYHGFLAQAHRLCGDGVATAACLDDAFAAADEFDEQFHIPALLRMKAALVLQTNTHAESANSLWQSIQIARNQSAIVNELLAWKDLANVLRQSGQLIKPTDCEEELSLSAAERSVEKLAAQIEIYDEEIPVLH